VDNAWLALCWSPSVDRPDPAARRIAESPRSAVHTFPSLDALAHAMPPVDLGASEWVQVEQSMIDRFAEATGDHQWIHTDAARAAQGPFGATIAHGYLTVALLPRLVSGLYEVHGAGMRVNYGMDRVRFPRPVVSGAKVRAHATVAEVAPTSAGVQLHLDVAVEIENEERPACVARTIVLVTDGGAQ
jgi:acyl dehydratase